jgi:hypothetical protein
MRYFVHVTIDSVPHEHAAYEKLKNDFKTIGLYGALMAQTKETVALPQCSFAGEFEGESTSTIRDDVAARVKQMLEANTLQTTAFVSVGGDWSWGIRYSKLASATTAG